LDGFFAQTIFSGYIEGDKVVCELVNKITTTTIKKY
jgi:hypothetical protein